MPQTQYNPNETYDIADDIINLIDLASEREIPLSQVQAIFKDACNLSARNFSGLKKRLQDISKIETLSRLKDSLENFVGNHIKFDDKMITLASDVNLSDFKQKLENVFNSTFEPVQYAYSTYKVEQLSKHQRLYQFTTIREINVRESLNVNSLKEDIVEDYQELIGIKKTKLRCYDFVLLDFEKNVIVVGVDLAQILGANEANIANLNFNNFLKKELGIEITELQKIDLFPKIKDFYNLPKNNDNGVIEIYFMTDEGTAHHETARGNTKDLRTATYHSSGVQGLKNIKSLNEILNADITVYRITSKFYQVDNDLQIALKSSYVAINTQNGSHLYEALIYGIKDLEQFNFVINKLLS
nr:hypothetical protein [Moraxella sp.]